MKNRLTDVSGATYINLYVLKDGSIDSVGVARGSGKIIDEEAIRIVKTLPPLIPAIVDGEFVNSKRTIRVRIN